MKKILIFLYLLLIVLLTLGCSKKDDLKYLSYGDFKVLYPQSSKIIEFSKTDLEMIFPSSEAYIQIDFSFYLYVQMLESFFLVSYSPNLYSNNHDKTDNLSRKYNQMTQ